MKSRSSSRQTRSRTRTPRVLAASTSSASARTLVTIMPWEGCPAACTTPLSGPAAARSSLTARRACSSSVMSARRTSTRAPRSSRRRSRRMRVLVGSSSPWAASHASQPAGGGERRAAQQTEHRAVGGGRDVLGHRQADAAETAGDQVDAAVAQAGAVGRERDGVEGAAPPVAAAQGEFGFVPGAGQCGEQCPYGVVLGARGSVPGDVQDAAGGVGRLLGDDGGRAEQQGVLGPQGFVTGDVVHAAAQHVDGDGHGGALAGGEGLGEGEQAVEAGAAGGVQALGSGPSRWRGVAGGAGGGAPQVDEAQAPPVRAVVGGRGERGDERGQVVALGRVHGPAVALARQVGARADAYDAVAGRGHVVGEGVAERDARAEHHPGVARGSGGPGREGAGASSRGRGTSRPVTRRPAPPRRCGGSARRARPSSGGAGRRSRAAGAGDAGRAVDGGPVDGGAGAPYGAQARQQVGVSRRCGRLGWRQRSGGGAARRSRRGARGRNWSRFWPGPTSSGTSAGSASSDVEGVGEPYRLPQVAHPSTSGLVACSSVIQVPVTFERNGTAGGRRATQRTSSVKGATAASMSGEWKACEVCSRRQPTPSSSSRCSRASTASGVPETTVSAVELTAARRQAVARARRHGLLLGQEDAEHRAVRHLLRPGGRGRRPGVRRPPGRTRPRGRRRRTRRCCGRPWRAAGRPRTATAGRGRTRRRTARAGRYGSAAAVRRPPARSADRPGRGRACAGPPRGAGRTGPRSGRTRRRRPVRGRTDRGPCRGTGRPARGRGTRPGRCRVPRRRRPRRPRAAAAR